MIPSFQICRGLNPSSQATKHRLGYVPKCRRRVASCPTTKMTAGIKLPRPILLFVTPDNFSKDVNAAIKLSQAALDGGTSLIQVRDRNGSADDIRAVVDALLSHDIPAHRLVVNGLAPSIVASIHPLLGVHIKEKDIDTLFPQVADNLPPSAIVGCAVHAAESASRALSLRRADYVQVGTMFATASHPGKVPEGPSLLKEVRTAVGPDTALVAIGGIDDSNVAVVMEHGADGIAVVTLLADAADPTATAASLMRVAKDAYKTAEM